jgi:hypothetical protein
MSNMATPPSAPGSDDRRDPSNLGRFIQTYSGFLSSFVIGVAGLIATSIWQYRQSQITSKQAESEQKLAEIKANNEWRIARAEILAKNLDVLSAQGPNAADQKFGVLLSLTRGAIIDPELAVSYALELGKDNAAYMRSVLASTDQKNYLQLATAFAMTCLQRYGVEKNANICKDDKLVDRSDAIAELIADELRAGMESNANLHGGPMGILAAERDVQAAPGKLSWLFEPYLQDLYERRQWAEVGRFETFSTGARLVAAVVLATARTGELLSPTEAAALARFHAERRTWLTTYLFGRGCDQECRANLVDVMLSLYGEAEGGFDEALKKILIMPRNDGSSLLAKVHARLLWCQMDGGDQALFRDKVLVPTLTAELGRPNRAKDDMEILEDLIGLVALVPEPKDEPGLGEWAKLTKALDASPDRLRRVFQARRATAARERSSPPPMIQRFNFCAR